MQVGCIRQASVHVFSGGYSGLLGASFFGLFDLRHVEAGFWVWLALQPKMFRVHCYLHSHQMSFPYFT
jgi:hypothetical protein